MMGNETDRLEPFALDVGSVIERMDKQIEEWDQDEPRSNWWSEQHLFLEARNILVVVNEGPPVMAVSSTAPDEAHTPSTPVAPDELIEEAARAMKPELFRKPDSEIGPVTRYERDFTRKLARAAAAPFMRRIEELERECAKWKGLLELRAALNHHDKPDARTQENRSTTETDNG